MNVDGGWGMGSLGGAVEVKRLRRIRKGAKAGFFPEAGSEAEAGLLS
jgi:hypothetical protein